MVVGFLELVAFLDILVDRVVVAAVARDAVAHFQDARQFFLVQRPRPGLMASGDRLAMDCGFSLGARVEVLD